MRSNRIRTTALAATALLAALSLTACSGDDVSTSDNGKAAASAPAANSSAKQSQSPTTAPEKDGTDADTNADDTSADTDNGKTGGTSESTAQVGTNGKKGGTASADKAGNTNSSTKTVTCTGDNTKVTVTKVSRPVNHLLLTLTNAGPHLCNAYYAPKLRFDDAQAVFPILEDSRPQAVVTLDRGQSAYASIGLTGEPGNGPAPRKATHLQVNFSGKSPEGSTGTSAELSLPANTYWDDNGFVTYWQTEMADALQY
ncbi:DUF4232 domain-containing protein [Streptomyces brevispora]|uniref:DUF4232 domain-containing protein n=1 Tax=Streptomyces brevispora TaxID=887462 RepID=A0A561UX37_9ACTN|nr:DUF4232 domain-containing protein [Streptomyces brevispora]TWG03907.1 uncharacterized protein DUF4232 [Streptomyces brevispora]WSC15059.1 DUF4232 domain-containing protein [Streptomyces brevispora]